MRFRTFAAAAPARALCLALGLTLAAIPPAARACDPNQTGVPDLDNSIVSWSLGAGQSATLLVVPDGSGPPFTAAHNAAGMLVDATITLQMIDFCGDPIFMFPAEDMWIQSADHGVVWCVGGACADGPTDRFGRTNWVLPRRAGGHSQAACQVLVNGMVVSDGPGLPLRINSPDINGDLDVGLVDIALFSAAYFGAYQAAADFTADGTLNILDVTILAAALGATCP